MTLVCFYATPYIPSPTRLHNCHPLLGCSSFVLNIDVGLTFLGQKLLRHASLQKHWVRQLKEAQENRNTTIKAFKLRVFDEFDTDCTLWLHAIRVFAELDCLPLERTFMPP
jgi:hypothetical protein